MNENLRLKIEQTIAGEDGFWKSNAQELVEKRILQLIDLGIDEDEAIAIIDDAFSAGCSQFGG